MLIDKNEYKESLSQLWHIVFGDDYSFIELIFNKAYKYSIICFAELDNERVVSAFYLIKNELKYDSALFNGYYLYAAATLPEYRGKGLMSKLIRQAQQYCAEQGIDFISLVPSEESLYSYYSALGFQRAMYRCVNDDTESLPDFSKGAELDNPMQVLYARREYNGNLISFTEDSFGYAFECMKNSGFAFKKITEASILITPDDSDSYGELISADKEEFLNALKLIGGEGMLTAPFGTKVNKSVPFGMLYPINNKLKRDWKFTDIYMNLALD